MEDEYANLPDETKMEVLWNLSYNDTLTMCMVSDSMNKICNKKYFWVKKYQKVLGKSPKNNNIPDLKRYLQYKYEIDHAKDYIMIELEKIFDKYYLGNRKYVNKDKLLKDMYVIVERVLKYDFEDYIDTDYVTLEMMESEEEEEYIKETIKEEYIDSVIEEIPEKLLGYDVDKFEELHIRDMEALYYVGDSRYDIVDIIYEIERKRYILKHI